MSDRQNSHNSSPPTGRAIDPAVEPGHQAAGKLPLAALIALVVGSMIGSGIFGLPSQMAGAAAPGPLLIGWGITGVGMLMLAFVFQTLAHRKPEIDGGVYGYAQAGFGNYLGFTSAWGYWVSAWIGNVSYLVLLMATLGTFFPIFGDGNTVPAIIGASVVLWATHALTLRGVQTAAFVNTIVTIAKVVPIITFVVIAAIGFKFDLFTMDFWGQGGDLGGTMTQVRAMMLITVWVFIGIEGASVFSERARNRSDIGRATVMGFVGVLALLILVNVLSYGAMAQADIAGLADPSMAGVLTALVGPWGAAFISIGLIISVLGAFLAWVLLTVQMLRLPTKDDNLPQWLGKSNRFGAPSHALWVTNSCVQLMLIWTYFNESTYLALILLASSLILLPYLWSAAYQVRLTTTGETYEDAPKSRRRDLIVGGIALVYTIWLVIAGGWEYVLVAGVFYVVGSALYVWARRKANKQVFTRREWGVFIVVVLLAIGGIIGIAMGVISVA